MQTSFIIMNSNVCDEKIDCSDLAVGRAQADRKSHTEKCLFREKKCIDRTTLAVRTTGRPYRTSAHILLENNF